MIRPKFICEKLHPEAKLPVYGSTKAADCDFFTPVAGTLAPGEQIIIKTGLKMKIPAGWRIKLEPRSGLAVKYMLDVMAGVIDEDYRKEIGIVLINHGNKPFEFEIGDRIAQGSVEQYFQADFEEGHVPDKDEESNRDGGFGSTGK